MTSKDETEVSDSASHVTLDDILGDQVVDCQVEIEESEHEVEGLEEDDPIEVEFSPVQFDHCYSKPAAVLPRFSESTDANVIQLVRMDESSELVNVKLEVDDDMAMELDQEESVLLLEGADVDSQIEVDERCRVTSIVSVKNNRVIFKSFDDSDRDSSDLMSIYMSKTGSKLNTKHRWLWQFMKELLEDRDETCIEWVDLNQRVFVINDQEVLAMKWESYKKMNGMKAQAWSSECIDFSSQCQFKRTTI